GGPFAIKRVIGQSISVEADVFTDGHDLLGAELLWRAADEKDWQRAPLTPLNNDRWRGTFTPTRIGRHLFTVEAWRDDFGTLCRTNRKGRNNSLTPGPDDHGSPYAIGSEEGGHDAIHPQLGTFDDFRRLVAAARENGLELALDFAIQCAPDHPWLREHKDWF